MNQVQITKKDVKKTARQIGLVTLLYNLMFIGIIWLVHQIGAHLFGGSNIDQFDRSFFDSGIPYFLAVGLGLIAMFACFFKRGTHKQLFHEEKKMTFVRFGAIFGVYYLIAFAGGLLGQAAELGLNLAGYTAQGVADMVSGQCNSVSMLLYTILLAPLAEELVYRGFLMRTLQKYGKVLSIVVTAVLFGLMHGNLVQAIPATLIGLALGFVASEYSIKWSILIHMLHNSLAVLIAALSTSMIGMLALSLVIYGIIAIGIVTLIRKRKSIAAWLRNNRSEKGRLMQVMTSIWMLLPIGYFIYQIIFLLEKC